MLLYSFHWTQSNIQIDVGFLLTIIFLGYASFWNWGINVSKFGGLFLVVEMVSLSLAKFHVDFPSSPIKRTLTLPKFHPTLFEFGPMFGQNFQPNLILTLPELGTLATDL